MRQLRADYAAADAQRGEVGLVAEPLGQPDRAAWLDNELCRATQDCLGVYVYDRTRLLRSAKSGEYAMTTHREPVIRNDPPRLGVRPGKD
jgi:hypothetical protein